MLQYDMIYEDLVHHILENGFKRDSTRGGVGTIGVFNYNYTYQLDEGFPLMTSKLVSWKNILLENLWFLSGEKDLSFLHHYGVKFWDPWAVEVSYRKLVKWDIIDMDTQDPHSRTESVPVFEDMVKHVVPSAYGSFWRRFRCHDLGEFYKSDVRMDHIDQIKWALQTLKNNPNCRQVCVTAWDPRNAMSSSLPPCHAFWVLSTEPDGNGGYRLNLHLTQRSCDVALGLPYNVAGYCFLIELFSRFLGFTPGEFGHTLVDAHIYENHIDAISEQIQRKYIGSPELVISPEITSLEQLDQLIKERPPIEEWLRLFDVVGYDPHPAIRYEPAV